MYLFYIVISLLLLSYHYKTLYYNVNNDSRASKRAEKGLQEQQMVEELQGIRGDLVSAQWGAQVRNYVLQPYTLVKDRSHF